MTIKSIGRVVPRAVSHVSEHQKLLIGRRRHVSQQSQHVALYRQTNKRVDGYNPIVSIRHRLQGWTHVQCYLNRPSNGPCSKHKITIDYLIFKVKNRLN